MIVFDHIKKTGGSSIWRELAQHFNTVVLNDRVEVHCDVNKKRGVEFVCGHDLFHNIRTDPHDFYFTVIRHPADVIYSWARHRWDKETVRGSWDGSIDVYVKAVIDQIVRNKFTYWQSHMQIDPDLYDFIGITEHMDVTFSVLSERLEITMEMRRDNTSTHTEAVDYRRDEVEKKLQQNIWQYEGLRAEFEKRFLRI